MRAGHHLLVAVLGLALLGNGSLPPVHFHHSTATRPQIVHSHLETIRLSGAPTLDISVDDDDHATAVQLGRVLASGRTIASDHQPALVAELVTLADASAAAAVVGPRGPSDTPSPPPRPTAPRAPPVSN